MKYNQDLLVQLMSMGFPEVRCKRALKNTGNCSAEAASEWLFCNMDTSGIDDPSSDGDESLEEKDEVIIGEGERGRGEEGEEEKPEDPVMAEKLAQLLGPYMAEIKVPKHSDKVYKDECLFTFDTAFSKDGLFICLQTYRGVGRRVLSEFYEATGQKIYLNIVKKRIPLPADENEEPTPNVVMIGPPKPKFRIEESHYLHAMPTDKQLCDADNPNLPSRVRHCIQALLSVDSATTKDELSSWTEKRLVSKHASNLVQLDNDVKIPPSGHKCSRCALTENLWLVLTDGTIVCGRKNYDGSGGNNHGVEYYNETKYPLAVKLGTISPEGADVYSYDEDDMVEDPNLAAHLAHFGIDIMSMEKTEKTIAQLELEQNLKHEWDSIQESGKILVPMYGPGYTGMQNLGNSCYMASVLQICFALPPFVAAYYEARPFLLLSNWGKRDAADNFHVQMSKIADGLLSGLYSSHPNTNEKFPLMAIPEDAGIKPSMFKALIGRGHAEFSTNKQQDAVEFFLYLMEIIKRNERSAKRSDIDPSDIFRYELEDRLVCGSTGGVRYSPREDVHLSLDIPLEAITNKEEFNEYQSKLAILKEAGQTVNEKDLPVVLPKVTLESCLEKFFASETLSDWISPATGCKSTANRTVRFKNFPRYLMICVRRFYLSDDWTPKKMEVSIEVPDQLDLSSHISKGIQPDEVPLVESTETEPEEPIISYDDEEAKQVIDMLKSAGFSENACEKAYRATKGRGTEEAMNWLLSNIDDATLNEPIMKARSSMEVDEKDVAMIQSMGFTERQANKALLATGNNVERSIDWLCSHAHELDNEEEEQLKDKKCKHSPCPLANDNGRYKLIGLISHMGPSTGCGHYVCHIKKKGNYVLYNDEKVVVSEQPPIGLGYMYLYEREVRG